MLKKNLLIALKKPINTAAISLMAVYTILWGFWVGNPFWDVFEQSTMYDKMSVAFPEAAWGTFALLIGIGMLLGVVVNSKRSLSWGSFVGFMHWLVISGLYVWSDWQNTAGLTGLMVAVYCAYIYLNIKINLK